MLLETWNRRDAEYGEFLGAQQRTQRLCGSLFHLTQNVAERLIFFAQPTFRP